ncbi:unnamed protein product [Ixodes pacificus]
MGFTIEVGNVGECHVRDSPVLTPFRPTRLHSLVPGGRAVRPGCTALGHQHRGGRQLERQLHRGCGLPSAHGRAVPLHLPHFYGAAALLLGLHLLLRAGDEKQERGRDLGPVPATGLPLSSQRPASSAAV